MFLRLQHRHRGLTAGDFSRLEFALQWLSLHGMIECRVIEGIRHWVARPPRAQVVRSTGNRKLPANGAVRFGRI